MFWPLVLINSLINLSETLTMPLSDRTSKYFSRLSVGRIHIASKVSQSSRYSSCKIDPKELAILSMPTSVRREHWLRFIDLKAGAEETSAASPPSEIRQAPFKEIVVNAGNPFGTKALCNEESDKQCPHRSSCKTWFHMTNKYQHHNIVEMEKDAMLEV